MRIFNWYIANSFAAYPEKELPVALFSRFRESCQGYPSAVALLPDGSVGGFGLLRAHNPMPAFQATAEISCFVRPDLTGNGLGSALYAVLVKEAEEQGIRTILASISSLNEGSIRFHARQGFRECGRFSGIGEKRAKVFDVIWMLKSIR